MKGAYSNDASIGIASILEGTKVSWASMVPFGVFRDADATSARTAVKHSRMVVSVADRFFILVRTFLQIYPNRSSVIADGGSLGAVS